MKIYVQFSDSTESSIIAVFGCPQDEDEYPHQGEIEDTSELYVEFMAKVHPL